MTKPPGIPPAQYTQTAHGTAVGYTDWRPFTVSKRFTNAFVHDLHAKKVLLGLKKRGFGHGMYNGFGGKVDPGESVQAAAMRELEEEANITAPLEPCGLLFFVGAGQPHAHHITVFSATTWQGDPAESDEMRPEWFAYPETGPDDSPDTEASAYADSDVPAHHTTELGSPNDLVSNPASNHNPTSTPSVSYPNLDCASNPYPKSDNLNPSATSPNSSATNPNPANPISDLAPFPYARMWKDDPLWIPHLLSNTPFVARVDYGPVPIPTEEPKLLAQGAGYELNGQTIESGMQRWWVATMSWDEWRARRVWEI